MPYEIFAHQGVQHGSFAPDVYPSLYHVVTLKAALNAVMALIFYGLIWHSIPYGLSHVANCTNTDFQIS
jgi:hypothetical protein